MTALIGHGGTWRNRETCEHRDAHAADLTRFRDLLVTARDRVQKLKAEGKSALEAVAEKPFADLDAAWNQSIVNSDRWFRSST